MQKLAILTAILSACLLAVTAAQAATVNAAASLIMVTWVNNGNPSGTVTPAQTSVGRFSGSGSTYDIAAKAAMADCLVAAKSWEGVDPAKTAITSAAPTQISFVCVLSE